MARTEEQNQRIREQRKAKIWEATMEVFYEKGLYAASISEISKRAGMSKGLLYHYYDSKADIYTDIVSDALDKMIQATEHVRDLKQSAAHKIDYALRHLLRTIEESRRFCETCRFIAEAMNPNIIPFETQAVISEKRDIPYQIMAQIMQEGQQQKEIVDGEPMMLAILFWTSINGLAVYYATRTQATVKVPDYHRIAGMFLKEGAQ